VVERREYLTLKSQLMAMTRVPTSDLGEEIEILEQLEIGSERVDAARDLCVRAYGDVHEAFVKHQKVQADIDELSKILDEGNLDDLAGEEAEEALELYENATENLVKTTELIEEAGQRVDACYEAITALEDAGVGRQR
jgi:hypothetical protein